MAIKANSNNLFRCFNVLSKLLCLCASNVKIHVRGNTVLFPKVSHVPYTTTDINFERERRESSQRQLDGCVICKLTVYYFTHIYWESQVSPTNLHIYKECSSMVRPQRSPCAPWASCDFDLHSVSMLQMPSRVSWMSGCRKAQNRFDSNQVLFTEFVVMTTAMYYVYSSPHTTGGCLMRQPLSCILGFSKDALATVNKHKIILLHIHLCKHG